MITFDFFGEQVLTSFNYANQPDILLYGWNRTIFQYLCSPYWSTKIAVLNRGHASAGGCK